MSDYDYDHEYSQEEVRSLVDDYEEMVKAGSSRFLDQFCFEHIIDYYGDLNEQEKAFGAAELALTQHPFSSMLMTKKAQVLFDMSCFEDALDLLEKAQVFDPADMSIYLLRSDIYAWLSRYQEAVSQLDIAAVYADKDEMDDLYLEYADIYEEWGKYGAAFKYLRKSLDANYSNYEALSRLNIIAQFAGKYEAAIGVYEKVIDHDPYCWLAWTNLGNAYYQLSLYEKAAEAYGYATAIDEKNALAHKGAGDSSFKLGNWNSAIESYRLALEKNNKEYKIFLSLGECYEKLNDPVKARYYYRRVIRLKPDCDKGWFRIASTYAMEQKWLSAARSCQKAISSNESDEYLPFLAKAYFNLGQYEKAAEVFQKAIDADCNEPGNWIGLAECHREEGNMAVAIEILKTASLNLFLDYGLEYYLCGYLYAAGRKKEAIAELEKGLSLNYEKHGILFTRFPFLAKDREISSLIRHFNTTV